MSGEASNDSNEQEGSAASPDRDGVVRLCGPAVDAYARWLQEQSPLAFQKWLERFRAAASDAFEGAVVEACCWDFFASRTDVSSLYDQPGQGGPDFEFARNGQAFLVEATCLPVQVVTRKTGLTDVPRSGKGQYFGLLTDAVKGKATKKASQIGDVDKPTVVCVATLHFTASALCLGPVEVEAMLHSTTSISAAFDPVTGVAGEPKCTADLSDSLFVPRPKLLNDDGTAVWTTVRRNISAVVVVPLGLMPSEVARRTRGVLHPDPVRPFEPSLLQDVPFCRFKTWPPIGDTLDFEWIQEDPKATD